MKSVDSILELLGRESLALIENLPIPLAKINLTCIFKKIIGSAYI